MKYLCSIIFVLISYSVVFGESIHDDLNHMSLNMYNELAKKHKGHVKNFVYSPYPVADILGLLSIGARGETASQIKSVLTMNLTDEKIGKEFKVLGKSLRSSDKISIQTAEKMYVAEGLVIEPEFVKVAHDSFDAGVENINFADSKAATKSINSWVEKQTNNKIKNIIPENTLDDLTRLVLVNTLYFKGNWEHPFKLSATSKAKFHNTKSESVDVDMMKLSATLQIGKDDSFGVSILRLPYEDDKAELLIILPNEIERFKPIENQLEKLWDIQNYTSTRVSVFLPRFRVESTMNLIPLLKNMGIKLLFEGADLKGITKEPIGVSAFQQKAFIDVDEFGTEAGAAAAAIADNRAVLEEPSEVFRVDHPFMFTLMYDGLEIMSGRVEKL
ncbi:hypothetical protein WA026_005617 [Henosepilachna vigintioctopunctata]|uniref:Serpin domain-containing protein n=1 Tax=Henosepilachna vigintioctopunctata TaxID=420089 RepID=A0AAW1U2C4_9CUCU